MGYLDRLDDGDHGSREGRSSGSKSRLKILIASHNRECYVHCKCVIWITFGSHMDGLEIYTSLAKHFATELVFQRELLFEQSNSCSMLCDTRKTGGRLLMVRHIYNSYFGLTQKSIKYIHEIVRTHFGSPHVLHPLNFLINYNAVSRSAENSV